MSWAMVDEYTDAGVRKHGIRSMAPGRQLVRTKIQRYVSGIQMCTVCFIEREHGPRPRTAEVISEPVRRELLRHMQMGGGGAYGWRFPEQCDHGRGP